MYSEMQGLNCMNAQLIKLGGCQFRYYKGLQRGTEKSLGDHTEEHPKGTGSFYMLYTGTYIPVTCTCTIFIFYEH